MDALTVGQLKERLAELPDDTPIIALYDCACAYGDVVDCNVGEASVGDLVTERADGTRIVGTLVPRAVILTVG